jgi:hypothetical protein
MLVVVGIPGVEDARLAAEFGLVVRMEAARLEVEVGWVVGVEIAATCTPLQSTGRSHGAVVEVVGGRICRLVQFWQLAEADRVLGLGSQVVAVAAATDVLGRLLDFPSDFPLDFRRGYSVLMVRKGVKAEAIGRTHLLHRTHCHRRNGPLSLDRIVAAAAAVVAWVLSVLEEDHEVAELSKAQADVVCYQDCNLSAAAVLS